MIFEGMFQVMTGSSILIMLNELLYLHLRTFKGNVWHIDIENVECLNRAF